MKRTVWAWLVLSLTVGVMGAGAGEINTDYSVGLYNGYMFRGAKVGPFCSVVDGAAAWHATERLTLTGRVLNATAFGAPSGLIENRLDVSARYKVASKVKLLGGFIYYDRNQRRPAIGANTSEYYLGVETNYLGLHPSLYMFYDIDNFVGSYWLGTLSRSWRLGNSGWNLDGLAAIGFDGGRRFRGYQNSLFSVDLNYPIANGLEFGPRVDIHLPADKLSAAANGFRVSGGFGFNYHKDW